MREFKIKDAVGGSAFTVRVVTRAANREVAGVQDDGALKVRLTSSPSDGNSVNEELVQLLAELLGVPTSAIEIVAGLKSREKLVSVEGIVPSALEQKLAE